MKNPQFNNRETGAVLIVSLLMLLIMTILAVTISQTSTLEQRMAGNARDQNAAFQAAEAGLRAGEDALNLAADAGSITFGPNLSSDTATEILHFSGTDLGTQNEAWWNTNGVEYGTAGTQNLAGLHADPRYVVTLRAEVGDSMTTGVLTPSKTTQYFEITAHAFGNTDTAQAVISAVIAIPIT